MKEFFSYQFEDMRLYQTPNLWQTYRSYNYILAKGQEAIVVDPGEFGPISRTLQANQLQLSKIYLTHHHGDHVGATQQLKEKWQCQVLGFKGDESRLPPLDQTFVDGQNLDWFGYQAKVIHLPGHTLGLCAFYIEDLNLIFSNDLLFSLGCGRVFEGTYQQMFESLKKLRSLPDSTLILCSHEYTAQNLAFGRALFPKDKALASIENAVLNQLAQERPTVPTPLGFEKQYNPFLRWDDPSIREQLEMTEAEDWEVFAEIRQLKDHS